MSFVAGIKQVISDRGFALMLQVTPRKEQELATYKTWWSARRVDGIFLTDLKVDDERLDLLARIGLPAGSSGTRRTPRARPRCGATMPRPPKPRSPAFMSWVICASPT